MVNFPSGLPLAAGTVYSDGAPSMSLGMNVRPNVGAIVTATAVRYFAAAGVTVRPRLWSPSGALLASGPAIVCTAGWNTLPLSAPFAMTGGTDVIVGIYQTGGTTYSAVTGAYPLAGGVLSANTSRFSDSGDGLSTNNAPTSAWYGVDLVATVTVQEGEPEPEPEPQPVGHPDGPYLPTNELVAVAWLGQRVPGLVPAQAATVLPGDVTKWAQQGFVQAQALPGGSPDIEVYSRHPVVQLDFWAVALDAQGNVGNRPPWNKANRLAELVRNATEGAQDGQYGKAVTMPDGYLGARVQAAYLVSEPRRITDDPSGYARFTADLALDWVRQ